MAATLPPGPRAPSIVNVARFARRPLDALLGWQERYGDVVTVPMAGFGIGVYVGEPEAIRELFTGDQSDLLAGEANAILEPVLGPHSVLVLDGPAHLRQRRLLLPPFQGSHVNEYRERHPRGGPARGRPAGSRAAAGPARADARRHLRGDLPGRLRRDRSVRVERLRDGAHGGDRHRDDLPGARVHARRPRRVEPGRQAGTAGCAPPTSCCARRSSCAGTSPTSRSAPTCCRSCCARATRTAADDRPRAARRAVHDARRGSRDDRRPAWRSRWSCCFATRTCSSGCATSWTAATTATSTRWSRRRCACGRSSTPCKRKLTKPRTVAGWDLPAGIKVYPAIVLVHHREDLYPRAKEFRPERFLDEGAESYTWLPFGGGIRRCIGAALAQAEMAEVLRVIVGRDRAGARRARTPTRWSCAGSRSCPSTACRWRSSARPGAKKFPIAG